MTEKAQLKLTRREFVILTTSVVACGCQQDGAGGAGAELVPRDVDAGPASDVRLDGVDERFRDQGFFLVRRRDRILAFSAICTHRNCKLYSRPDRSFICKCHGSMFDPSGHVTAGPATRDLPAFATSVDARGHLTVYMGKAAGSE